MGVIVLGGNCPTNRGNCPQDNFPTGVMVLWGSCLGGNCPRGSCPQGSCPRGSCPRGSCPVTTLVLCLVGLCNDTMDSYVSRW